MEKVVRRDRLWAACNEYALTQRQIKEKQDRLNYLKGIIFDLNGGGIEPGTNIEVEGPYESSPEYVITVQHGRINARVNTSKLRILAEERFGDAGIRLVNDTVTKKVSRPPFRVKRKDSDGATG